MNALPARRDSTPAAAIITISTSRRKMNHGRKRPDACLAEGEGIRLHTGDEKLGPQGTVANAALLTDQLIETSFRDDTVAISVGIHAMVSARRLSIDGDSEAHGRSVARRPQHQMKIAGVKAVGDASSRSEGGCDLALVAPLPGESPLIEFELC